MQITFWEVDWEEYDDETGEWDYHSESFPTTQSAVEFIKSLKKDPSCKNIEYGEI